MPAVNGAMKCIPSVVSLFFSLEETLALRALVACLSYYNKNSRRRRRISYERFFKLKIFNLVNFRLKDFQIFMFLDQIA